MLYLQVTALGPLVVSGFWAAVSERFDPYTAKQNVSRLSGAGALAGVVAGIAAERVVSLAGTGWALGLLAALALLAASSVRAVGTSPDAAPPAPDAATEGSSDELGAETNAQDWLGPGMKGADQLLAVLDEVVWR